MYVRFNTEEDKTYLSYESLCNVKSNVNMSNDVHTLEFLNTIASFWLPDYKLRLKVGIMIMLLWNIDHSLGLCSDTQLIIIKIGRYILEGQVIFGSNIGQKIFIPRLSLRHFD
jgi:ATP-dependent DNA helicase PIF1